MKIPLCRSNLYLGTRFSTPRPALFLDRDGVLIEDRHYLCDPDLVAICPGLTELISRANSLAIPVVVVTNQSGIARSFYDWSHYDRVTQRMLDLLKPLDIAAIYASGHSSLSNSNWRKPRPGMLLEAARVLNLDLSKSLIIGDRLSDLQAGFAAHLNTLIHVLTGYGISARQPVVEWHSSLKSLYPQVPKLVLSDHISVGTHSILESL